MNIEEYLKLPYTREMVQEADGSYFISIKELPGCMSSGDTQEEALKMIEDAMRAWITVALEEGKHIPLPDATDNEEYSGKFVLRIPKSLHRSLARKAKEEQVSLNQYATYLLSENNAKRAGHTSHFQANGFSKGERVP